MQMLKCVLVDDELPGLSYLRMLCTEIDGVEVVKAYNNPLKFLAELGQLDFNICILDIEMPGMNGTDVAKRLQGKAVIFCTAYKAYAAEAFDLEAVDYITKPLQLERLKKAFVKASLLVAQQQQTDAFIEINSDKGKFLLRFAELAFISSSDIDRRDKKAVLKNNQEVILKNISFDQLLAKLPASQFTRINRKTIIALDCVEAYTHDSVLTKLVDVNGSLMRFPLSTQFSASLKAKFKS